MNRRAFLGRAFACGSLVALGGCTEEALEAAESRPEALEDLYHEEELVLPVQQKFERMEAGVHLAEEAEIRTLAQFEAYLREQELAVEEVSEDAGGSESLLSLEYVVDDGFERGQAFEVGLVAGAYAALVEAGYDGEEAAVTLLDLDGRAFGEFTVRTTAAERYVDGETTATTYGKEAMRELHST